MAGKGQNLRIAITKRIVNPEILTRPKMMIKIIKKRILRLLVIEEDMEKVRRILK